MKTSDTSKSNILYLDSGSGIGGGQRSLLLLLNRLDKAHFTPFVGCLGDSAFAGEVEKTAANVIPLSLPAAHNKTDKVKRFTFHDLFEDFRQLRVIFELHRAVKRYAIDLIHANSLSVALLGGIVARINRIPILMHKRYATSYGILDRLCERLLHRVILVSEATRWDFASAEKQTLIYNGVDLDAFQASPEEVEVLRAELFPDAPNAAILVGVVTRITPEKGIHFLVRAMRELKGRTNVKLLIVGGPYFQKDVDYMDTLKQEVADLGIEDSVIFTGFLSDTRIVTSLLDIVLVPSIIPEACPRTIIEAMAVGKPVIATPLGGSKELVTAETGILVPPEDASAVAEAIATLATDQERLIEMGKAARDRAVQLFSSEKNTALTETVYTELLAAY
ncbi:glycosyltransferase family 4 protein [Candidatus Poribacteria bacterium]|nr:glycosyltransferase family 4 protein [Candidatus Poribacteria bacterium]MYH79379.1 glycosyltransferase family 4 protein [Candidatus Poribacteria bacterium]MYK93869.1 glycosyltransferase family 4 protein [Candidatus Poribacteria bacterium]